MVFIWGIPAVDYIYKTAGKVFGCVILDNPENILNYEQLVEAITSEDLKKAANKFLTLNNMVKAVLYPESSTITPGVKTVKPF